VLEIDIKEFASNFSKYDKGSAIYEVSKRLLTKKKNKNRYFYYDCRREDCAFDFSSFGNCFFVNHGLKDNQRRIIKSLLSILFRSRAEQQEQLIQQIHKILLNYRILLPYTISETVEG
jgi:mannitol/fructose-specific phosphotransferase system IIA component